MVKVDEDIYGQIVFGSTSSYQSVPCWHGCQPVSNLYVMDADGSHVRQLCFDQDHNYHPTVLPSGQVAGVIDELLSCEDLINSIVQEAQQRLALLALRVTEN